MLFRSIEEGDERRETREVAPGELLRGWRRGRDLRRLPLSAAREVQAAREARGCGDDHDGEGRAHGQRLAGRAESGRPPEEIEEGAGRDRCGLAVPPPGGP